MSEKRRDNKNRILRSGESQRKDGRYAYKYTDTFGKVQFAYARKLLLPNKNIGNLVMLKESGDFIRRML